MPRTVPRVKAPRRTQSAKLSRAATYALQVVMGLKQNLAMRLPTVARERGIPERLLLKVLKPLVSAGLVKRQKTGYQLTRPPAQISVQEVVDAVEKPIAAARPSKVADKTPLGRKPARPVMAAVNPREEYVASGAVVRLLKQNQPSPPKHEMPVVRAQAESTSGSLTRDKDLAPLVGERIEGLLANLARRAAAAGEPEVVLSNGQRFLPEVGTELIERLEIDPYGAAEFLDGLHNDLAQFAAVRRERNWGQLAVASGKLALQVAVDKAKPAAFARLDQSPWDVTQ